MVVLFALTPWVAAMGLRDLHILIGVLSFVILLLPVGFVLILLQGISEMIKRAAALRGFHQHEYAYEKPLQ